MSASEVSDYEIDELVERVVDDEPMEYEEILEEVRMLKGGQISHKEVRDVLEGEDSYERSLIRSEDGDLTVNYRLSENDEGLVNLYEWG